MEKPYCSLIDYDPDYEKSNAWLGKDEIVEYLRSKKGKIYIKDIIKRLLDIFNLDRFRVSLISIPNIITKHPEKGTKEAFIDLLYPRVCFPEGFPLNREQNREL
ncbi:MAG: hypothetical protein JSV32_01470 [Dehalococcoidia bacterium]|nr:MAG: hypothetical protein JSV32_01470 [Dehalococcoidia bacterium]